ncbi:DUF881 domain-containing protein [Rhodococcus sp. IEGM 1366]|uniref:DUF881 domain-containing protein n=1 Tax=Rhodococcus sp. IEGM 1366 TaxID=3082223 RepID=UPI002954DA86|nr:DUF881 domain-containing protein [Rhodococcus sp. IEGM 1366]MDV8067997.1 DUF881 domain-containing protein [Rhodococcus sp. IEGM 1366]
MADAVRKHDEGRHELRPVNKHRSNVVFAILATVLLGVLGVAIATQVRSTVAGDSLDSARPADLLVVLDNLNRREAALRQEVSELEDSLATLRRSGSTDAALGEAQARLNALSVQVGTAPASGPGVTMTLTDPTGGVGPEVILDLIQELRAAGAEAIQIAGATGEPIRIGVNSWVGGRGGDIEVDGTKIAAPYTVSAIGDPPTLAAALNIPGGVFDNVSRGGGSSTVEQSQQVTISALRQLNPRQYAQPGN